MEEDSLNKQGLSNAVNSNSRGKEVGGRGWCVDTEWQGKMQEALLGINKSSQCVADAIALKILTYTTESVP